MKNWRIDIYPENFHIAYSDYYGKRPYRKAYLRWVPIWRSVVDPICDRLPESRRQAGSRESLRMDKELR